MTVSQKLDRVIDKLRSPQEQMIYVGPGYTKGDAILDLEEIAEDIQALLRDDDAA